MEPDVFHITTAREWDAARVTGEYRAASLATEGFVHCSTREQVIATANRYYRGRTDLVLLWIARESVAHALRFEESRPGEFFPHVHAPVAVGAVRAVAALAPDADGVFRTFPTALPERA